MKTLLIVIFNSWAIVSFAQSAKEWTKADRQYLVDNFKRTKAEVNNETANLTSAQWNFKEAADKWSIGQVMEHLYMWELVTLENVRYATYLGPNPEIAKLVPSDSSNTSFIYEERPHTSPDFTIPTGFITDGNNLKIFNAKCDEIIKNIETSDLNFRQHVREGKDGYHRDMNQMYMIQFGHVDRHLRQIKRIKQHTQFPK